MKDLNSIEFRENDNSLMHVNELANQGVGFVIWYEGTKIVIRLTKEEKFKLIRFLSKHRPS